MRSTGFPNFSIQGGERSIHLAVEKLVQEVLVAYAAVAGVCTSTLLSLVALIVLQLKDAPYKR